MTKIYRTESAMKLHAQAIKHYQLSHNIKCIKILHAWRIERLIQPYLILENDGDGDGDGDGCNGYSNDDDNYNDD